MGSTLLYAELRHSGAGASDVMNTRAIASFAWVAGPPLATLIMGVLGNRSILPVLAGVGLLNVATTLIMISGRRSAQGGAAPAAVAREHERQPVRKPAIAALTAAFVLLQATNSAAVSVMSLFVTAQLGLVHAPAPETTAPAAETSKAAAESHDAVAFKLRGDPVVSDRGARGDRTGRWQPWTAAGRAPDCRRRTRPA